MENWCWLEKSASGIVVAEGHLPSNSVSRLQEIGQQVQFNRLLRLCDTEEEEFKVKVSLFSGYLCSLSSPDSNWFPFVRPAADVLEQNCELCWTEDQSAGQRKSYLRLTRDVQHGQELKVWFSPDLIAMLEVPLLGPANILGVESYVCCRCREVFKQPNPLKVHLMLSCRQLKTDNEQAFIRKREDFPRLGALHYIPRPESDVTNSVEANHRRRNDTTIHYSTRINLEDFSSSIHQYGNNSEAIIDHHRPGIHEKCIARENVAGKPALNFLKESSRLQSPESAIKETSNHHHRDKEVKVLNGHACQYCGKVYSRRYGLKIHVRTHTGYKPLECRFCLRSFSDPSNLNKHIRLHSEVDTPYKCSLCGKVLVRRRDLDRHLRSRHPTHQV